MSEGHVPERLDSWKEIAVHLGRGVRTVQRWEKEEGLPVHRHLHSRQGTVYAFKSEVDEWWARRRMSLEAATPRETALRAWTRRNVFIAAAVAIALIAAATTALLQLRRAPAAPSVDSLAVLPFTSVSPAQRDPGLEVGLADALSMQLSRSTNLTVSPASAVAPFHESGIDPVEAARRLKVDAVLEGRIERVADRVRLDAQLIETATGRPLWAGMFDERVSNVFELQNELAERVLAALLVRLTDDSRARNRRLVTGDPVAYVAYLEGRWFWNKRTAANLRKAVERLSTAVSRDARFALAHAALSEAYVMAAVYGAMPAPEVIPLAKRAAQAALEVDDTLGSAHASLGMIAQVYEWEWQTADREYRRATEVDPGYATAHHWYGELLGQLGRSEEAIASLQRARALDPLSLIINTDLGRAYYFARRYDEAVAQFRRTLELDPQYVVAHVWLGKSEIERGHYADALNAVADVRSIDDTPQTASVAAEALAASGRHTEARRLMRDLERHPNPMWMAMVAARLRDRAALLRWLRMCLDEHAPIAEVYASPALDAYRDDPGVTALFGKAGLPFAPNRAS